MRKSATNDDVLSTREAAERLGVALRTVQLWVEAGVLPAWKTAGGHRRISRQAVERLMGQRRMALADDSTHQPALAQVDARLRVMVVEDEPELLRLFVMMIDSWELPVIVTPAASGFEALLLIGQQRPDLLMTDLNMPGMDGFKMIASLRTVASACDDMEIVVVTALTTEEIGRRGGLPDGVRVFRKPLPFDELASLMRGLTTSLAPVT